MMDVGLISISFSIFHSISQLLILIRNDDNNSTKKFIKNKINKNPFYLNIVNCNGFNFIFTNKMRIWRKNGKT